MPTEERGLSPPKTGRHQPDLRGPAGRPPPLTNAFKASPTLLRCQVARVCLAVNAATRRVRSLHLLANERTHTTLVPDSTERRTSSSSRRRRRAARHPTRGWGTAPLFGRQPPFAPLFFSREARAEGEEEAARRQHRGSSAHGFDGVDRRRRLSRLPRRRRKVAPAGGAGARRPARSHWPAARISLGASSEARPLPAPPTPSPCHGGQGARFSPFSPPSSPRSRLPLSPRCCCGLAASGIPPPPPAAATAVARQLGPVCGHCPSDAGRSTIPAASQRAIRDSFSPPASSACERSGA